MIQFISGNVLDSDAQALVNTVNLVGVMGKGVALQFKNAYPTNFKAYKKACLDGSIAIGKLFVTEVVDMIGHRFIINFPTKTDWRKPSEYQYIEAGLDDLVKVIVNKNIQSIAIPPLGAGNGGLHWELVKRIIVSKLQDLDVDIRVYEPTAKIVEHMNAERIRLTPARSLLLYVLYDLVRHGEYVSEFSSEKVCYFLQKFGASDLFGLQFEPCYYGPYSRRVRYVLNAMNGSYIMGYSGMNTKPFDALTLVPDAYGEVKAYVENDNYLLEITKRTTAFLDGFYSDYGLELLSSVDYILSKEKQLTVAEIYERLCEWNHRKELLFSNVNHIEIAKQRIESVEI